jgi:RimJ/RimL family protein N-acetyltransferase
MISAWWLVVAFVGGGLAGTVLAALMHMAAHQPRQSERVPELNGTPW